MIRKTMGEVNRGNDEKEEKRRKGKKMEKENRINNRKEKG